jgi:hypothetical protein
MPRVFVGLWSITFAVVDVVREHLSSADAACDV